MSLPSFLKPETSYDLIRVGKDNDGGYLAEKNSIYNSKYLISLGIFDDWSFEKDFTKLNPSAKIFCYDSLVNSNFFLKKIIKNIVFIIYFGFSNLFKSINLYFDFKKFFTKNFFENRFIYYNDLNNIFNEHKLDNGVFLKIDIEGSEYRILKDLIKNKEKIIGLCIEFHDIDLHIDKINKFINEIDLTLIHIHPNNFGRKDEANNPTVIELSFAKDANTTNKKNVLPNILDQKNNPLFEDIKLMFN